MSALGLLCADKKSCKMSQNSKPVQQYFVESDYDNDSFYSFVQSDENSDDVKDLSNIDEDADDTLTDVNEVNVGIDLESSNSSPNIDVAFGENNASFANGVKVTRSLNTNKQQFEKKLPMRQARTFTEHHLVPKPRCDSPMPSLDVFNMDAPGKRCESAEQAPIDQIEKEALQKLAFTEIWVKRQQNYPSRHRPLHRQFATALDNYFVKEETYELEALTITEQQKANTIKKPLIVEPTESTTALLNCKFTIDLDNYFAKKDANELKKEKLKKQLPSTTAASSDFQAAHDTQSYMSHFDNMSEIPKEKQLPGQKAYVTMAADSDFTNLMEDEQPYVSPFEDLPEMPKEKKKLPGQKSYIIVPAGFDLTNLVKYRNPNHWHRRSTTRYDNRP